MNAQKKKRLKAAFDLLTVASDSLGDTMPVRQVLTLLSVALRSAEGTSTADLRDVAKDVKAVSPVTSRDLLVLGKRGREGKDGLGLVTIREDYTDLRRRPYVLTPKGSALVNKMMETL